MKITNEIIIRSIEKLMETGNFEEHCKLCANITYNVLATRESTEKFINECCAEKYNHTLWRFFEVLASARGWWRQ